MKELLKVVSYDRDTGKFTWSKKHHRNIVIGREVGSIVSGGYLRVNYKYKPYLLHRVAYFIEHGELPDNIDHINHIRDDNRACNLRSVTKGENNRNATISHRNKSGTVGVCWVKTRNRWCSSISVNGKMKNLGRFKNKTDAITAIKEAEKKYGYHVNHGARKGSL